MNLILLSTVLSLIFGTLLSIFESLWLQLILVVVSWLAIRRFGGQRNVIIVSFVVAVSAMWWGNTWLHWQLSHRLPLSISGESVEFSGCISSTPQINNSQVSFSQSTSSVSTNVKRMERFELTLDENQLSPRGVRKARLSWYRILDPASDAKSEMIRLNVGTCLKGIAKLRTPRNFENGLAYDYQAAMLYRGIDATGYIRSATITHQNSTSQLDGVKQKIIQDLPEQARPWVLGLVFGDKSAFSHDQWALVQHTGTLHLLVVSGLHVGLLALAGMLLGMFIARSARATISLFKPTPFLIPTAVFVLNWLPVAFAILTATIYVMVAGAGLSLVRAWVMLLFILLVWYYPKRLNPGLSLLGAAVAILAINPLSWTQSGFWFSFTAVAALVFFFRGRKSTKLSAFLLPQLVIIAALIPVSVALDQPVNLIHIIANTIAIPMITFCILPLTFLSLGVFADLSVSQYAVQGLLWASDVYWQMLAVVKGFGAPVIPNIPMYPKQMLLGWCALVVLVALGARMMILLFAGISLYVSSIYMPLSNTPGVWLIDSGQGQSLIVTDTQHAVVIDTGPALSAEFSIASMVLVPVLRDLNVRQLDYLVLSHSDNDHAGGVMDLINAFEIDHILVGQPIAYLESNLSSVVDNCHTQNVATLSEQFRLEFFQIPQLIQTDDNNSSCVVKLHWYGHTFIIPGDASIDVERYLVAENAQSLQGDILIAGHHGSRTSTSRFWLNTVNPAEVWISSGYGNRFGHPHDEVVAKIADQGARLRNTAEAGKISMTPAGDVETARDGWQPLWRE